MYSSSFLQFSVRLHFIKRSRNFGFAGQCFRSSFLFSLMCYFQFSLFLVLFIVSVRRPGERFVLRPGTRFPFTGHEPWTDPGWTSDRVNRSSRCSRTYRSSRFLISNSSRLVGRVLVSGQKCNSAGNCYKTFARGFIFLRNMTLTNTIHIFNTHVYIFRNGLLNINFTKKIHVIPKPFSRYSLCVLCFLFLFSPFVSLISSTSFHPFSFCVTKFNNRNISVQTFSLSPVSLSLSLSLSFSLSKRITHLFPSPR